MFRKSYRQGDLVVYRKMKHRTHPSRRARGVRPAAHGDDYSYYIEKFWVVSEVLPDDRIVLQTPRAKRHVVPAGDPNLRHANLVDRLVHSRRFRRTAASVVGK